MKDFSWLHTRESARRRTIKTVMILFTVTILYSVYRYQGSSQFFMLYLHRSTSLKDAQAASIYYQWVMSFFLLGLIPVFIIKTGLRERLRDYGFFLKKPVISLLITLLGVVFATPFIYFGARMQDVTAIYPLVHNAGLSPLFFLKTAGFYFLYYIGYEICFRGFLFMGIREDIGDLQAIAVSLIVTVLIHVTQPQSELMLAILVGIAFPLILRNIQSLWPVILIHAYAGISLDYWIIINGGGFAG